MTERKTPAKPYGWVVDASISRTICMLGSLMQSSHSGRPVQMRHAMRELLTSVVRIDIDSFTSEGLVHSSSLSPELAFEIWQKEQAATRNKSQMARDALYRLQSLSIAARPGDHKVFGVPANTGMEKIKKYNKMPSLPCPISHR